jgi:hypothetical protein
LGLGYSSHVGLNMVLDPKHFDDIDDFGDFEEKLEASEGDLGEVGPSHPLSWRRVIIERAVNNVKKALESKVDVTGHYKKGELVFDSEANKFGRVIESKPGFLNLSLLGGGKLVRRDMDQMGFVRDNRQNMTLPEMAEKLFLKEFDVIALLNQLELETDKKAVKNKAVVPQMANKKPVVKVEHKLAHSKKKPALKTASPKDTLKKSKKSIPVKMAAKKNDVVQKKPAAQKDTSISFTRLLPKGATTDPVRDPNGYIQQNFLLMSNRELSVATGLSEHTIRRKLGEWSLKRKDFINKA